MAERLERGFLFVNRLACGLLLAASCTLVFANVVLRYGFGVSLAWAEEVSRYMMIWLALLASGLALREGAHIAVETLPDSLPRALAVPLRGLAVLLVAGFLALMLWLGWYYAQFAMMQRTPVLRLPVGMIYLAIPIGMGLMLLHLLLIARRLVLAERSDAERMRAMEAGSL
jgi:TRAP-type C4-dicarboxylate transport system permease small subunit